MMMMLITVTIIALLMLFEDHTMTRTLYSHSSFSHSKESSKEHNFSLSASFSLSVNKALIAAVRLNKACRNPNFDTCCSHASFYLRTEHIKNKWRKQVGIRVSCYHVNEKGKKSK